MPLLPATLPLWAYLAAGGGAFVAAKLAGGASSPGAGPTAPGAATPAGDQLAGGAGDLWAGYGDQTAQFGAGGSIGFLPQVTIPGDTSLGDLLGGPPVTTPPPSTPPPTPAGAAWYPSWLGSPPAGTAGYVSVKGTVWVYTVSGGRIASRQAYSNATFSAFVGPVANYSWPGHGTYRLVKVLSGSYRGKYLPLPAAGIAYTPKR